MRITHVFFYEENLFALNFKKFLEKHFDITEHVFLFVSFKKTGNFIKKIEDNVFLLGFENYKYALKFFKKSEKIIFHSLFSDIINNLVLKKEEVIPKIHWVMWGGDFNPIDSQPEVRTKLMKKVKHFITDNYYDFEYVNKSLNISDKILHKSFMYPSNIFKPLENNDKILNNNGNQINILVGNSADPSHLHFEALKILEGYKNENIKIFVPLSYCKVNKNYSDLLIKYGLETFKDKFIPLTKLMPLKEYRKFLNSIDIAIFPAKRQQAMGNIITLIGFGKKVYIRNTTTTYKMFKDMEVQIFNIDDFSLEKINTKVALKNTEKIKNHYSEENLKKQLKGIFQC